MSELTVLVPTRGRPESVRRQYEAFRETGTFDDGADVLYLADESDPRLAEYQQEINELPQSLGFSGRASLVICNGPWQPMVSKLNAISYGQACISPSPLAFMGDDHLPRTENWVGRVLKEMTGGPVILSGPDGLRTDQLPTWWVMSQSVVYALGGMVPAPVEHLYCDNSVRDVAMGASCYRWMPDLLVEHVHPAAGKAEMDDGYRAVNSSRQYKADRTRYAAWAWKRMKADVEKINALRESHG